LVNLTPISYAAIVYGIVVNLGKLIVDASANLLNLNNVPGFAVRNEAFLRKAYFLSRVFLYKMF
jgi:hypothetical protein